MKRFVLSLAAALAVAGGTDACDYSQQEFRIERVRVQRFRVEPVEVEQVEVRERVRVKQSFSSRQSFSLRQSLSGGRQSFRSVERVRVR